MKTQIKELLTRIELNNNLDMERNNILNFRTKTELIKAMHDIKTIADELNFNYQYGNKNAYAVYNFEKHKVIFNAPRAKNGDDNYYEYSDNYGFTIDLTILQKKEGVDENESFENRYEQIFI